MAQDRVARRKTEAEEFAGIICGLAAKHGLSLVNSPGTVDPDYRGEIKVILVNLSNTPYELKPGERVAQLVVARFTRVEWESVEVLGETERGAGGFGSTGTK